jgi:hypothetical protein
MKWLPLSDVLSQLSFAVTVISEHVASITPFMAVLAKHNMLHRGHNKPDRPAADSYR